MKSHWIKQIFNSKLFLSLVVVVVLLVLSAIPPLYSFGKLSVGYDTFIPFYPEHSLKMIWQWTDRYNGIYTLNLYSVWISVFLVLKKIGLSIYEATFVYQVLIFFLSGLGIYKSFNLFNSRDSKLFGLVPAAFFIYSPYLLDHQLYQLGTIGIVWSIYIFLKFAVRKRLAFWDPIILSCSLLTIIDLPNPKYHFLLFVSFVCIVFFSYLLSIIDFEVIKRNVKQYIWTLLLSSSIIFPFLYFGYSFQAFNPYQISIKKDYAASGEAIDYGVALIHKMIRLFHTPNLPSQSVEIINSALPFFSYYLLPILILGVFPFVIYKTSKNRRKYFFLIYLLAVFFVFLSKGSNPPYGVFYEFLLSVRQLVFMRTTAGIVIYAAIFYALIFGFLFEYFYHHVKSKFLTVLFFSILIIVYGFPYWSGLYYLSRVNITTKQGKYGITIPKDYFQAADFLKNRDSDSKIQIIPFVEGYQSNSWGYFGFVYYPWLFEQPVVSSSQDTVEGLLQQNTNTKYIVYDKSILKQKTFPEIVLPEDLLLIYSSKNLDIYQKKVGDYTPHIYTSGNNLITDAIPHNLLNQTGLKDKNSSIFSINNQQDLLLKIPEKVINKPKVRYRKINPTKYTVEVQNATETFPLIFTENFHPDWRLYLKNGRSLFAPEIRDSHLLVNKNFNAWLINPAELCKKFSGCTHNEDGSYNFEFQIEFFPQRIANVGIIVSLVSLVLYVVIQGYFLSKKSHES